MDQRYLADRDDPQIGVLLLEVPPDDFPGSIVDPAAFPGGALYETVPGAWVDNMVEADPALVEPAVAAARKLEARGARLLVSNCGFFIAYKAEIERHVSIPVAISSLLWLPHLEAMRRHDARIGLITYDSQKLTEHHLRAAWPGMDPAALAIAGLEGTKMWHDAGLREAVYDFDQIWRDLRDTADRLIERTPDIGAILLECAVLCPFAPLLRRHTGLPVHDIVSLAHAWQLGCEGARERASRSRRS